MAFWVELMCDVRADGPPDPTRTEPLCYSDRRILIGRLVANGSMAYGKRVLKFPSSAGCSVGDIGKAIGGVLAGLLGLAIVAVVLSGKSQTSNAQAR